MSYSLTLFAPDTPVEPRGIRMSAHMIGFGLREEFGRLSHVRLQYVNSAAPFEVPSSDFALIHDYFDSPVYTSLESLRARVRHRIIGIMEVVYDSPLIDYAYSFRPTGLPNTEQVPLPCLGSLLRSHTTLEKAPGSILMDHGWIEDDTRTDVCEALYRWLEPFKGHRRIAQLRRRDHERGPLPGWIDWIAESSYPDYLSATADFETFIVTHPGSYEHSIIDMAARGTRVLVPFSGGRPFVDRSLIDDLDLDTFETAEDLLRLLAMSRPRPMLTGRFTDITEIVGNIDAYCRRVLAGGL